MKCDKCNGDGYIIVPEHASYCKGECQNCPVPVQMLCDKCQGDGEIDWEGFMADTQGQSADDVYSKATIYVNRIESDLEAELDRLRETAQILIEEIGAKGPMNAEGAATIAVEVIRDLRSDLEAAKAVWKERIEKAVYESCTCGGDRPDRCCPACKVWFSLRKHYRAEAEKEQGE